MIGDVLKIYCTVALLLDQYPGTVYTVYRVGIPGYNDSTRVGELQAGRITEIFCKTCTQTYCAVCTLDNEMLSCCHVVEI